MPTTRRFPRKPILLAGATAALAVAFGAGALAAFAFDGDDDPKSPANGVVIPGISRAEPGNQPAPGPQVSQPARQSPPSTGPADKVAGGTSLPFRPYCQGALPAGVAGPTINPGAAGVTPRVLSDGFVARSIGVRSEGECDDKGNAKSAVTVVDSSWGHDGTGLDVWVSQRPTKRPATAVFYPGSALFTSGGYEFTVTANLAYPAAAIDGGAPEPLPAATAPDVPATARGGGAPASPSIAPYPADPRAQEAIEAAIKQLAPELSLQCFYRQAEGGWADLASLGIGDPRPAVPSGFVEQYVQVAVFAPPASACGTTPPTEGGSFSASFGSKGGRGYLYVSAYGIPAGAFVGTGFLDDGNANWSNGKFQFSVSGLEGEKPLGRDRIIAIAKAMDPSFSAVCLVTSRQLDPSELAGLGFRAPVPPPGFTITETGLHLSEVPKECANPPQGAGRSVNLSWLMVNNAGANIQASANRFDGQKVEPYPGYITDYGLNWMGADGTNYAVYSFDTSKEASVGREALIAIAKSMDPALDVSKLTDGGEAPVKPVAGGR